MTIGNFSSLFSRHFLVGFLAAPLAGLFVLSQLLNEDWLPRGYLDATASTRVVIVGATAISIALVLSGLQYPIVRLLEGYPFSDAKVCGWWYRRRVALWQRKFDSLLLAKEATEASSERTAAARKLNSCFPAQRKDLLPTAFGNVMRAFETHPRARYGLDGVTIWPRIMLLLGPEERRLVEDASTGMYFAINTLVTTVFVGAVLAANFAVHSGSTLEGAAYAMSIGGGAIAVAEMCRRWSIDAARRWGNPVRAAMDLHRFELYDRLGVQMPETYDEELVVGRVVTRLLLYGEPVPAEHRVKNMRKELEDARRSEASSSERGSARSKEPSRA